MTRRGSRVETPLVVLAAVLSMSGCGVKRQVHGAALEQGAMLEQRVAALTAENQDRRQRLAEQRRRLAELARRAELSQAELERRLDELRAEDEAQARRVAELRRFVEGARRGLSKHGVDVRVRHGRMLVALPDGLLFDSGKAELKPGAREILDDLARVIEEASPRGFRVTGHTDSVPIRTRRHGSNWDLSTARAVAVVRYLTDHGLDPTRLVATGRASNEPVADNDTAAGRAQNRRIEVVLEPDLSELPDVSAAIVPEI